MTADVTHRLDAFDLGLDLRQPGNDADDSPPSNDPWYPVWCLDWGVTHVHLSASVLCVTVRPRRLPGARRTESSKEELRTLLRFVAQLAAEYGLLRPVVGMVLLDDCADAGQRTSEGDGGGHQDTTAEVRAWAGDQDWHRGEFLLFVETRYEEYRRRCLDLLAPAPEQWSQAEHAESRDVAGILREAAPAAASNGGNELLRELLRAAGDFGHGRGGDGNPLVDSLARWLDERRRDIDPRLAPWEPKEDAPARESESGRSPVESDPIVLQGTITRIEKLEIKNFRGFGSVGRDKPFVLDLDADLVLLAGANGLGKTSLMEALDLLLTGYHHFRDPHHLFHFDEQCKFELAGTFRIVATESTGPSGQRVRVTCRGRRSRNEDGAWKSPQITWSVEREAGSEADRSAIVRPLAASFQRMFGEDVVTVGTVARAAELLSRRTAIYPDRLQGLFDETTTGYTLRDYLEPVPRVLTDLLRAVDGVREHVSRWRDRIENEAKEPDVETIRDAVDAALAAFAEPYGVLSGSAPGWPPLPSSSDESSLSGFVTELLARGGESASEKELPDRLPRIVDSLRRAEIRSAGATRERPWGAAIKEIARRMQECADRLKEMYDRYPRLDEDVLAFDAREGRPGLLAVLEALGGHASSWREAAEARSSSLDALLTELRRVRPEDALKCAGELRDYLDPRKEALRERRRLREEYASLQAELERAERSERAAELFEVGDRLERAASGLGNAWRQYRDARERKRQAERAKSKLPRLDELEAVLGMTADLVDGAVKPSDSLRESVETLANAVLSRLAQTGETLRLAVKADPDDDDRSGEAGRRRRYTIATEDRRAPPVLSFGQRTQVGVSMAIAENRLLELKSQLGHRVFLMDDLSATYDLANLSRDAVFWRQMAYGSGAHGAGSAAPDSPERQVFLSSHHEDLSNRLLDVMPPIRGRRMLLYRFTGWRKGKGPDIEVYDVEPQPPLDAPAEGGALDGGQEERDGFQEWLQAQLTETVDEPA